MITKDVIVPMQVIVLVVVKARWRGNEGEGVGCVVMLLNAVIPKATVTIS